MTNKEAIMILESVQPSCEKYSYSESEIYEAIDMAISALAEQRWIPVAERLPKDGEEVFVYLFNPKSPYIAWVEDGCWYTEEFKVNRKYEPSAWMPLPEPWKGDCNDNQND